MDLPQPNDGPQSKPPPEVNSCPDSPNPNSESGQSEKLPIDHQEPKAPHRVTNIRPIGPGGMPWGYGGIGPF